MTWWSGIALRRGVRAELVQICPRVVYQCSPTRITAFVDSAVQRLSVALQRSIQRDQILRSHLRRAKRGGDDAPDGYYHGCGDGGYESGAASSSSSGGGGGAGGFGGGEHSVSGGSASGCSGSRPGVPRSAG